MRNPKRIEKVLNDLKTVWENHPDLRLGQLLLNVLHDPALYYIEDEELIKKLKEYYRPSCKKFGNVMRACFCCKKQATCKAEKIEECKFELQDNVAVFPDVE